MDTLIKFYKTLYSSNHIDDNKEQDYLDKIQCEKGKNIEKKICDELPTSEECKLERENMKSNKSPGQDGLSAEFYKVFWDDLKDIYYKSLLKYIEIGAPPFS